MINSQKLNLTPTQLAYIKVTSSPNPVSWKSEDLQLALNEKIPKKFENLIIESGLIGHDLLSNSYEIFLECMLEFKQQLSVIEKMKLKSFYDEIIVLKDLFEQNSLQIEQIKQEQVQQNNNDIQFGKQNTQSFQQTQSLQNATLHSEIDLIKKAKSENIYYEQEASKHMILNIEESQVEEIIDRKQENQFGSFAQLQNNENVNERQNYQNQKPFEKHFDQNCFDVEVGSLVANQQSSSKQINQQSQISNADDEEEEEDDDDDDDDENQVEEVFTNEKMSFQKFNNDLMSTDTFNYPIQQEQQKQNINNQKQSIQKNNKDDEQEEDDDEDDDDDDDDDDDESEQAQEIVCYPKKLEITPQGPQGGSQKDEFTMFKVKPIRQDQAQNQISPNQKMGQQQNTFQPTQQEKQKQYQEIQQTTKFYEATNQMKPDQKQTQLFIQKNQAEEETKYYDQFALKNGDYQSTTFDLTQQKQPLDWKLLDYIVTVSSKEQGQNFQYHKQEHELIYPDNPTKFVINISRIKDDNIKYNYIINSQDCSRNHIQILCDDQYRFYLGKNQGRNGTFIKSKEFEEITSNTELQVGNIFLEFKSVQIIENEEKAYLKINAFSITQQESYQEKQIEINKLNHFLIGRNHSTIFDLFQKDTQLSRKHGEIRLVQVDVFDANLNRNIKKWKVIFCQFAARNGSWIKISDKQYIGNDSIIKVGIQNFLHINISAQKPQKQFDLKALQPNCQNPCKLVQNYLLNCNLAYPKQTHSSEILIGLGCGHTFCKDCDQNHFQKLLKEENSQFLKKLCPICNQENNSCPLNLN